MKSILTSSVLSIMVSTTVFEIVNIGSIPVGRYAASIFLYLQSLVSITIDCKPNLRVNMTNS